MTWIIHIKGQVQGVGFRPFVWRAALERNLKGWVANGLEGVLININGTEQDAIDFQQYILNNTPETARVTDSSIAPADHDTFFDLFSIKDSQQEGLPILHLTPDVAPCKNCLAEIHDPANRRYHYAFTTCTICGPRYSILSGLPYDRPLTAMQSFEMCANCKAEYKDPRNRRYYAQTNSCPTCGITMQLFDCRGNHPIAESLEREQIIDAISDAWQNGAIIAIKGIGGFLLTCDATNPAAVALLRARKQRPSKPFAMMYPDLFTMKGDAEVHQAAEQQLTSAAAPIVLLEVLEKPQSGFDHTGIAPGLGKIGAMLPNAPLFDLLLRKFGKPIVATSGNISNTPLVYENEKALLELSPIADFILTHNRDILMPQDDSIIGSAESFSAAFILRRARGLAPAFIQTGLQVPETTILALGAEMKSTFTLAHLGNLNISQYLGDLSDFDTQERFHLVLQHLLGLFKAQATRVLADLHPAYYTTTLGQQLAEQWRCSFIPVQHHKAHFAAVLAENKLFEGHEPVLGVIWDGTGFGEDGQIWGGEFFTYQLQNQHDKSNIFERCAHFDYFPVLLGDKMPREPRLSALSACSGIAGADEWLKAKFTGVEWDLYRKLSRRNEQVKTSSVGRIFDGVASLLGLGDKISYEGEAAMLLENMAWRYCRRNGVPFELDYFNITMTSESPYRLETAGLFRQIVRDLIEGKEKGFIAAKFHFSMARSIGQVAAHLNIKKIAFSGGVFQNTLLLDMIQQLLSPDYQLYFHRQLSPNDENISFGQWAYVVANDSFKNNNN